ncbi:hypothetical protein K5549_011131 [Capra hircus]|nr:hypothetical protein K5549_011131 [Capra hircus]
MKPHLKQWRQGMLCGVFAWGLLFVVIFLYFTDSSPAKPSPSSFSFLETRRLLPVQGRQRAIMGASEGLPDGADSRRGSPRGLPSGPLRTWAGDGFEHEPEFLSAQPGRMSLSAFPPEDPAPGTSGRLSPGDPVRIAGPRAGAHPGRHWLIITLSECHRNLRPEHALKQAPTCSWIFASALTQRFMIRIVERYVKNKHLHNSICKDKKEAFPFHKLASLSIGPRDARLSEDQKTCSIAWNARSRLFLETQIPASVWEMGGWREALQRSTIRRTERRVDRQCREVPILHAFMCDYLGEAQPDSHDAVLRFNSAPTRGYEKDVGNKTTVRIINSQILTNPSYHFMDSALYKDVILVAWDPAPYSANLNLWYKKPDYNLFTPYVQHRQRNPNQPFYILHPKFIWQLWDIIQENTKEKIQPNPPSSGFIGILLMMNLCGEVHVYEYVPSVRQTDLCHYHEPYHDAACTLGAYHPLLYEKLLVQRLNVGTHGDLHRKGKVVLPGLQAVRCPPGA